MLCQENDIPTGGGRMRMKKADCIILGILLSCSLAAETFFYKYHPGEKYKIISVVDEKVYTNGKFDYRSEIINRIMVAVNDIRDDSGFLQASFFVSQRGWGSNDMYQLDDEYYTEYWRDKTGICTFGKRYFMPIVRDVPVFPDKDIVTGYVWQGTGEEVHDLRAFGIDEPFWFPIQVEYQYIGKEKKDGSTYDAFSIRYVIYTEFRDPEKIQAGYPHKVTGYSDQILFWDNVMGRPYAYEEEFGLSLYFPDFSSFEVFGTANAKVIESGIADKQKTADEIKKTIDREGIEDMSVSVDDEGVTITLTNIQFSPDSAEINPSEYEKIEQTAKILSGYPSNDILITGHTALAGTEEGRQILSEQRAAAVGEMLYKLSGIGRSQFIIRGLGATRPIADNSTEEGKKLNRRVEIKILDY